MNTDMIISGERGVGKTNNFMRTFRLELEQDNRFPNTIIGDFHLSEYLIDISPETKTGFQELYVNDDKKTFGWYVFEPLAFRSELQRNGGREGEGFHDKVNNNYLGTIARLKSLEELAEIKPEIVDYNMKIIGPEENLSASAKKQYEALGINVFQTISYSQLKEKVVNYLVEKGVLE